MVKGQYTIAALALAAAACSPPASESAPPQAAASAVPSEIAAAASAAAPNPFQPVRVIESRQTADGAVVFELFRTADQGGSGGGPMEVRWHGGKATVITPAS